MKQRIKPKQIYLVLFALSASTFFLSHCTSKNDTIKATVTAPVFEDYAGSQKCGSCHKDIYEQYVQTSHHFTSMPAEGKNINGSFGNNKNFFSSEPSSNFCKNSLKLNFFVSLLFIRS